MNNDLLYTSELAKLLQVSEHTIRYYTEKGLISPSKITDAGYHLYGFRAIRKLEQVLALKTLDMPLKDIKAYMSHRGPDTYVNQLNQIYDSANKKINQLKAIQSQISNHLEMVNKYTQYKNQPFIDTVDTRYLLYIMDLDSKYAFNVPLDLFYKTLIDKHFLDSVEYSRNLVIFQQNQHYKLCIHLKNPDLGAVDKTQCIELTKGRYLSIFHPTQTKSDVDKRALLISNFIRDRKLTIKDQSIDLYASSYYIFNKEKEASLFQVPLIST